MFNQQFRYGFVLATWLALAAVAVYVALHHAVTHTEFLMP